MSLHSSHSPDLDVLIVGGGVAGLWLLDELRRAGIGALLVEAHALGSGQSVASQGILHSGLKHALGGRLGSHVDALKDMPDTWRKCLDGVQEPDLKRVLRRGDFCHCWRTDSLMSRFGQMGARIGLRVSLNPVADPDRPLPLNGAPGTVYRLDEQVVDPASVIAVLADRNRERLVHGQILNVEIAPTSRAAATMIGGADRRTPIVVHPRSVVLAAGEGNAALREKWKLPSGAMRRLPLSFLALRGNLPTLNGFCIDGAKAKVIVTTQRLSENQAVWQVASENVSDCEPQAFERRVLNELREALPEFDMPDVAVRVLTATRAEAVMPDGSRASDVQVLREGNVLTAWPTKFVLAPRLAERVMALLPPPACGPEAVAAFAKWPRPPIAAYPWD